jgi:7,8-dihydropterin-6-yl-methyl-4-(beta-D-ribofuranosyl)aminobenzene 5'-phosphate synthase
MLKCSQLKITTIMDSTATVIDNMTGGRRLLSQWGFCVLIEAGDKAFLLDTGTSSATMHNVEVLGIDIKTVDAIVLSHGHYDHTEGMQAVLTGINRKSIRIVAHPEALGLKYEKFETNNGGNVYKYTGIPFKKELLENLGADFELTTKPTWLTDDIVVSGEEPMTTSYESVIKEAVTKTTNGYEQDDLPDDQSIYIRTDLGLVIVMGCAHRGMINIIKHALELMGEERVYMVLGGTHLITASKYQLDSTIKDLKKINPQWIGVSHCTGLKASAVLANEFGDKFFFNNAGTVLKFPYEDTDGSNVG